MQTKIFRLIVMSALMLLGALPARAAFAFQEQVQDVEARCPRLNCPEEAVWVVRLTAAEMKQLTPAQRDAMKTALEANIDAQWPRILESAGLRNLNRLRIERFEKLIINLDHVGYRVTYSEKAWDLNSCDSAGLAAAPMNLDSCETGRIYESAFVDMNLQDPFVDPAAVATYYPDSDDFKGPIKKSVTP